MWFMRFNFICLRFVFILLPLTRWKTIIIVSIMLGPESALYIHGLPQVCNSGKAYDETNTLGSFLNRFKNKWFIFFNLLLIGKISWKNPRYVVTADRGRMTLWNMNTAPYKVINNRKYVMILMILSLEWIEMTRPN